MEAQQLKEVYCTLLVNDDELNKAKVLAHSLRRGGAEKQLAVLVTPNVSALTRRRLRQNFRYVLRVPQHSSAVSMPRIHLWEQAHLFSQIVFLGIDALCARAPEELFDLQDVDFAAIPLLRSSRFSSEVMVLRPCLEAFQQMQALAHAWLIPNDGDDAVLNAHFPTFHRLSHMYHLELNRNRPQYMPAVKDILDTLAIVRFGGRERPCQLDPDHLSFGNSEFARLYSRFVSFWWDIQEESIVEHEAARRQRVGAPQRKTDSQPAAPPVNNNSGGVDLAAAPSFLATAALDYAGS